MERSKSSRIEGAITIFAMNCYLIPGLLVDKNNSSCVNQDRRAEKIGKLAANCDLVVLQEVWGSRVDLLQTPMVNSHQIAPENISWNLFGYGASIIDSVRFYLKSNGGLWFANNKVHLKSTIHIHEYVAIANFFVYVQDFTQIKVWRHKFTASQTKSKKGLQAILLDMSARWGPQKYLIVANTHLDPSDRTSQKQQLIEIAQVSFHGK